MIQEKWKTLYELHYSTLLSFATIYLQNPMTAEDIVQETFLNFMEQEQKGGSMQKKKTLLTIFTILLEQEILTEELLTIPYEDDFLILKKEGNSNTALSQYYQQRDTIKKKHETLIHSLSFLTKQEQLLFSNVFLKRKTSKELLSFYNLPSATIRKRVERCKKHLKKIYFASENG